MISIILRKSKGDLMQELNAVLKNGGYVGKSPASKPDITYSKGIYKWDIAGNKDALRCFLANDGPSAIRFLYIRIFFPQQYINQKSFGGLITDVDRGREKNLLVLSKYPTADVSEISTGGSKKQKQKKTKKNKKNKKMKNNKKLKKTKKSKTKKNRKTKKTKNRKNRRTNKLHKIK